MKNNWFEFIPVFSHFSFVYYKAGYFDERPLISICLGFGQLFLKLPVHTGILSHNSDKYGVYYYEDALWFYWGSYHKVINMPWQWTWVRTSILLKNMTWEHETIKNRKDFYKSKWNKKKYVVTRSYTYELANGVKQKRKAYVTVNEMEWRWRSLLWFSLIKKIRMYIDVVFNDEVGERTGSWKGGCMGCSYEMKRGENPLDSLRRMEREKKFD